MTPKANPTDAKDLALHFVKLTQTEILPHVMARTINSVKMLLAQGHSKGDIQYTIDRVLEKNGSVYSFGYIVKSIDDILAEREVLRAKEEVRIQASEIRERMDSSSEVKQSEVLGEDDSTKRNRQKARNIGIQSRLREKSYFDMFEK